MNAAKQWYYVENSDRVGPIPEESLAALIKEQKLTADSFVWRKGMENWKKIAEVDDLQAYLSPEVPSPSIPDPIPAPLAPESDVVDWSKLLNSEERIFCIRQTLQGNIYGPYSLAEIKQLFAEKRVNAKSVIGAPQMGGWKLLADLPNFEEIFMSRPPLIEEEERRQLQRRPFVAKMFFHNNERLFEGLCQDISLGGMQVLVAGFPGKRGERISLNVHPENRQHHFVAEGVVGRVLEGDQGIFIRFTKISDEAKESIATYLQSEEECSKE